MNGRGLVANSCLTINVVEEGNEWLYTSAIVRLKPMRDAEEFKQELKSRGIGGIQVRNGGGRDMVMTFDSVKGMQESLKSMEGWIHVWSVSIKKWKEGLAIEQ